MKVTAHLHTILQRHTPEGLKGRLDVNIQPGSTVEDLIKHLEIDLEPDYLLLAVNGRVAPLDQVLEQADHVNLMLPISGG